MKEASHIKQIQTTPWNAGDPARTLHIINSELETGKSEQQKTTCLLQKNSQLIANGTIYSFIFERVSFFDARTL